MADDEWLPLSSGRFWAFYLSRAPRSSKDWKRLDAQTQGKMLGRLRVMGEAEVLPDNYVTALKNHKAIKGFSEIKFNTAKAHRAMSYLFDRTWVICTIVEHPPDGAAYSAEIEKANFVLGQHLEIADSAQKS